METELARAKGAKGTDGDGTSDGGGVDGGVVDREEVVATVVELYREGTER